MIGARSYRRPSRVQCFLAAVLGLFLADNAIAQHVKLPAGQPVFGAVDTTVPDRASAFFRVTVPDDAYRLNIALDNSLVDLDLYLSIDDQIIALSDYPSYNEELTLTRISEPPLETGTYTVEVAYPFSYLPIVDGSVLSEVPFSIEANLVRIAPAKPLELGHPIDGELTPEKGMLDSYRIAVPTGVSTLRIDLFDSSGDVDLFLTRGRPVAQPFDADIWAQTVRSTEILTVDRDTFPRLAAGTYYLLVLDQIASDAPTSYSLSAVTSSEPPDWLPMPRAIPDQVTDVDRAMVSTVEILTDVAGGSGCLVSPSGHVLTNWHVVEGDDGSVARDITVGLSLDPTVPPQEEYQAAVVAHDRERDLALLRITADRYGRPLPEGTVFPYLSPATSVPRMGDPLHVFGYPWNGGTGSRATITYSRGVVSGYQSTRFGTILKTDADISEGSSGGAALDDQFRLVGLPTETVGADTGQLAFIYPLAAVPEAWVDQYSAR